MDEQKRAKIEREIEFSLKLNMDEDRDRSYYIYLLRKKLNGENLNFDSITETELRRLFWDELVNRNQIAELFDVSIYQLDKKKKELGVMEARYKTESIIKQYHEFQESIKEANIAREQVAISSEKPNLSIVNKRLIQAFTFDHSEQEVFSKKEVLNIIREVIGELRNDNL